MAKVKIADLSTISGAVDSADLLVLVDASDTTDSAEGTTKKVTSANLLGAGINAAFGNLTTTGTTTLGDSGDATTVNGTLGVTGAATFSSSVNNLGINTTSTSTTIYSNYILYKNTGGDFYIGQESSSAGGFFTGSSAYASVFYSNTAQEFIIGGVRRLQIASTGAATFAGTLGVTGAIKTSSHNLVNEASVLKFSQESNAVSQIVAYGATTGTAGTLNIKMKSSDASVDHNAISIANTGAVTMAGTLGVTGLLTVDANIKFPATQVASADANTLDDYEEGTWTPTGSSGVNATGITWSFGKYTKIGNKVTLSCEFNLTVTSSNLLTYLTLSGIPFVPSSTQNGISALNNNIRCGFSQITTSYLYAFYPVPSAVVAGVEVGAINISYLT